VKRPSLLPIFRWRASNLEPISGKVSGTKREVLGAAVKATGATENPLDTDVELHWTVDDVGDHSRVVRGGTVEICGCKEDVSRRVR
jgi:hypothetical protein